MQNQTLLYRTNVELHNASPQRYYTSRSQTIAIRNIARLYPGETRRDCAIPAPHSSQLHYTIALQELRYKLYQPYQWERKVYYSNSSSTSPEFSEAMYASNASLNALPSFVVTPRILLVLPPITVLPSSASSSQRKRPFLPEPLH